MSAKNTSLSDSFTAPTDVKASRNSGALGASDFITLMEKSLLVVIAFLTAYAVMVEIISVVSTRAVKLTDLLLLFIYAEVLGMVAAFYKYRKIPITVPIFIAIRPEYAKHEL